MANTYICIDLKSFYASVECVDLNLDPLTTNLVVADLERSEKTICLAVTPALKSFGVSSRPRLFEVISKVKEINNERRKKINYHKFKNKSYNKNDLINNDYLELDYLIATPKMAHYIEVSSEIYGIYLKYFSKEDIHVYSIDEVFIDVTSYLKMYNDNPNELVKLIIKDILNQTGITATAGIGTNLYLAKVAMDIVAKRKQPDEYGVRIAMLDESSYKKELWDYRPLNDFWRVGYGYVKRLEKLGLYTMGDIALCSIKNEDVLYDEFGINAELLIDHAWGIEPTTIEDVKKYKPKSNSLSTGQVLSCPYDYKKGKLIVKEMTELLSLDLVEKGLVTSQLTLSIGYDAESLNDNKYKGPVELDHYGRPIPKGVHSSINLDGFTSSTTELMDAIIILFNKIVDPSLLIRRVVICASIIMKASDYQPKPKFRQYSLFDNPDEIDNLEEEKIKKRENERKLQKAIITIKNKYGKNAIVKGMNLEEGGTTIERNEQIGGHKS